MGDHRVPKVVDHDQRRVELVQATWRIIAREGIDRATMRGIAAEAGFANGALKPYFPAKSELLTYAFGYVFDQTNARIAEAVGGLRGMAALRAFGLEVLPLDDERLDEARIVIPFWQAAAHDAEKARIHARSMEQWRRTLEKHVGEALSGDARRQADPVQAAGALLNYLLGAQVAAVLLPAGSSPRELTAQLDGWLASLGAAPAPGAGREP